MANVCIVLGLASYSRRRSSKLTQRDFLVQLSAMLQIILSGTLSLVLWIRSPHFKGDPCAKQTPFLLFFKDVGATKRAGRIVSVAVVALFCLLYFWITIRELRRRYKSRKTDLEAVANTADPESRKVASEASVDPPPSIQISEPRTLMRTPQTQRSRVGSGSGSGLGPIRAGRKRRDRSYGFSRLKPYMLGALFVEFLVLPYFVANNELLVRKSQDRASGWGFGQVRAHCFSR